MLKLVRRRLRQVFGISAARMTVRANLSWRWKALGLTSLLLIVAGMWWWGFDFGRVLAVAGFDPHETRELRERLAAETAELKASNAALRASAMRLESQLSMAKGAQSTLSQQALELQNENAQLKEDLVFLQRLVSGAGKEGTLTIERLEVTPARGNDYRVSVLIVRGGNPESEFVGRCEIVATVISNGQPTTLILPQDEPRSQAPLALKFRYYQRVEGTFHVPPGSLFKTVQVRILETGQTAAKASRILNLS